MVGFKRYPEAKNFEKRRGGRKIVLPIPRCSRADFLNFLQADIFKGISFYEIDQHLQNFRSWYSRVCVCVSVFISFHRRGFSWLKQNNECNAGDQASDVVLRKSLCVKYIHHHNIDNHSRDLPANNCARVLIRLGGATRNKRKLLKISENQR